MRRAPIKRRWVKPAGVIQADIWRKDLGPCLLCGKTTGLDGHHVIKAQTLRRLGLREYLMDTRNRISLCRDDHAAHHSGARPVTRTELPASVFEFAAEVGLGWWLDKHYPSVEAAA